jgi:uncharacterized protein (DUF1810 family)
MNDPHNLQRFVEAQSPIYEQVCSELRDGRKLSHWMWFIFPQLRGLGYSHMAVAFGISSNEEAQEYLKHSVLGPRLRECTRLVNVVEGRSIHYILGSPDDMKFRSSMSLFALVAPSDPVFKEALDKYFGGKVDPHTVELLESM